MSTTNPNNPERLDQLMVDAATQGLSPQDAAELATAFERNPALRFEAEAYELAATAVDLALSKPGQSEALPATLRKKLIASAPADRATTQAAPPLKLADSPTPAKQSGAGAPLSWTDGRAFGWYAAVAALVALCIVLLQPNQPTGTTTPTPEPTLAEQYDALANESSTVKAAWGFAGGDADEQYANCTGEVIWNSDEQAGYMKLAGLPVNDPTKTQYQLWIVDGSRDINIENTNRIDGGVFDIATTGEVIVPIDAKLIARDAAAFAITVETPGGVVESKGPLQVLAVVDTAG